MNAVNPHGEAINAQPSKAEAVTPSDSTVVAYRGLYVGVGGDISVDMLNDSSATIHKNVPSGYFMPILVSKVNLTGTTATDIIGYK